MSTTTTGKATASPPREHDDVRWLTADEQRAWRAYRDGTARLLDVLAHELEEDSGLSLGEYEVLVRLSEAPQRTLRMSELAGELAHSRSRLTHTVRRMDVGCGRSVMTIFMPERKSRSAIPVAISPAPRITTSIFISPFRCCFINIT